MQPNCPICGASTSIRGVRHDDRYGYPGGFALRACAGCGHAFLEAAFKPEELRALYTRYYPRATFDLARFQPYRERSGFGAWLDGEKASPFRWVPREVRVLDIGCGFGESLAYHEARGCEVYGVEADENIRRVAEAFGYRVHVGLFDPDVYAADYFDYVTLSQVIEHVTDPVQTLRGVAHVLKPGGVAILSTPNANGWGATVFGRRWINWHAPYHLQFFTRRSMALAAEQAGLVVQTAVTLTPSAWLHFQWIHLLAYPRAGQPSVFWAPGGAWTLPQKLVLGLLRVLHQCRVNHLITRLFDALGRGDSSVYVLRKP
jgi:SAM-dependent methyltransferase